MKGFALTFKLVCEVVAFAGLFYWGLTTGPVMISVILAFGTPGLAAWVWAKWCAPKAKERLESPFLQLVELSVFTAGAIAIAISISALIAVLFVIAFSMNAYALSQLGLGDA